MCLPSTTAVRWGELPHLAFILALHIFGRLREFCATVNKSGNLACRLFEFFRESEAAGVDVASKTSATCAVGYTGACDGMISYFTFDRDVQPRWEHAQAEASSISCSR